MRVRARATSQHQQPPRSSRRVSSQALIAEHQSRLVVDAPTQQHEWFCTWYERSDRLCCCSLSESTRVDSPGAP